MQTDGTPKLCLLLFLELLLSKYFSGLLMVVVMSTTLLENFWGAHQVMTDKTRSFSLFTSFFLSHTFVLLVLVGYTRIYKLYVISTNMF